MHKNHLGHIHTQVNSFKLKFYKNFLTCKIEITHCTYAHLTKTIVTTWKVIHLSLSSNKIIVMLFLLMFSCTCLFPQVSSYPHYCITIHHFFNPRHYSIVLKALCGAIFSTWCVNYSTLFFNLGYYITL